MKVHAIETLHQMWLDKMFVYELFCHLYPEMPAVDAATNDFALANVQIWPRAPRFRSYVLRNSPQGSLGEVISTFVPQAGDKETRRIVLRRDPYTIASLDIAMWSWEGRRLYRISTELQEILSGTSIERFIWENLKLPFPSYAVALDSPIRDENGCIYSDILITEHQIDYENTNRTLIHLWLVSQEYHGLSPYRAEALRKQALKHQKRNVQHHVSAMTQEFRRSGIQLFRFWADQRTISEIVSQLEEKQHGQTLLLRQALRIAAGLALYLEMLPPNTPHVRQLQSEGRRRNSGEPKAISDEALVFDVSSAISLDSQRLSEDMEAMQAGSHQSPSTHWREAHWRRRPGEGQDPNAPRAVHVRRTLVRAGLLLPGTLPAGAVKKL